jgi:hypothetical protein
MDALRYARARRAIETIGCYAARTGELPQDIHGTVFTTLSGRLPGLTWAEYVAALDELVDDGWREWQISTGRPEIPPDLMAR